MSNINLSDAFMIKDYQEGLKRNQPPKQKPIEIPQDALNLDTLNNSQLVGENLRKYGDAYAVAMINKIAQQEAQPKELTQQEKILKMVKEGKSTQYILDQFNND